MFFIIGQPINNVLKCNGIVITNVSVHQCKIVR